MICFYDNNVNNVLEFFDVIKIILHTYKFVELICIRYAITIYILSRIMKMDFITII